MSTDITFTEEHALLRDTARDFCRKQSPISIVRQHLDSDTGFDVADWQRIAELGWLSVALPERHGGLGLGMVGLVSIAEMMGEQLLSTPFFSSVLVAEALHRGGSDRQCERWLPAIMEGGIATIAHLESEDWQAAPRLSASPAADGWTLQGSKFAVMDAGNAALFLVSALTPEGPAWFLVERTALKNDAIAAHTLIDETKRAGRVNFEGVAVTAEQRLPADFDALWRDLFLLGALLTAAEATGSCAASLRTTVDYLNTRKQFGKLIGSYQALKHPCVDILCDLDSARSLIYHAATLCGEDGLGRDAEIACRMAKAKASEALANAGDRGIQFHGAMGFTYECDAQLYMRRAQWSRQQFGDAMHHRKVLATLLLD